MISILIYPSARYRYPRGFNYNYLIHCLHPFFRRKMSGTPIKEKNNRYLFNIKNNSHTDGEILFQTSHYTECRRSLITLGTQYNNLIFYINHGYAYIGTRGDSFVWYL